MKLETDRMIPVSKLQKELTKKVRDVSETGEPLYILKNNNMEAVMLSFKEYEQLYLIDELFEQMEIKSMIDKRLLDYNPENSIFWDDIREDA